MPFAHLFAVCLARDGRRDEPVAFADKEIAATEPVDYASDWRSEKVDDVCAVCTAAAIVDDCEPRVGAESETESKGKDRVHTSAQCESQSAVDSKGDANGWQSVDGGAEEKAQ